MSYEPTIIIKCSDLEKNIESFELERYVLDCESDEYKVLEYLYDVYEKHDRVKIDDVEIVLCMPEFSSFNALVRKKLDYWGVQYGVSN